MIHFGAHFESNPQTASFKFSTGLGIPVGEEIKRILANPSTPLKFSPTVSAAPKKVLIENASLRTLAELTLKITTAKEITWRLGTSKVMYRQDIEKALGKVPWERILPPSSTLALRITTAKSRLYHSGLIEEESNKFFQAKNFIVERKAAAFTTIDISLNNNVFALGIALGGEPLNHRGYRSSLAHQAPLNEILAAGIINFAFDEISKEDLRLNVAPTDIHVPFAGTGTFGLEALLKFGNIAPCIFRENYAIEKFIPVSENSSLHTRKKARNDIATDLPKLLFIDNSEKAISSLKANLSHVTKLLNEIDIKLPSAVVEPLDFFEWKSPPASSGVTCLLLNPPYGHRMATAEKLYPRLGAQLRRLYQHSSHPVWGVCLTPPGNQAEQFLKTLQPTFNRRITLRNGGLATEAVVFIL